MLYQDGNISDKNIIVGYDKEAIAYFRKIDYLNSLNGHNQYTSSNTFRNSIKMAINFDSNFNRFKKELTGGYYSETYHNPSSFAKKVSLIFF